MLSVTRLQRVFTHDGIVAVMAMDAQQRARGEMSWVGDEAWRELLREAAALRALTNESQIRVQVGDHALLLAGEGDDVIGLVFVKGHPVVKSVVRMVRQLLRHARKASAAAANGPGPVSAPAPAPVAPPTPAAALAPEPPSGTGTGTGGLGGMF